MTFTSRDLTELLTLLLLRREEDGEGGWTERWEKGSQVWAALCPVLDKQEIPHYQIVVRSDITLPPKPLFLWHLLHATKYLHVTIFPRLIQNNRFLFMTAREDNRA